MAKFSSVAAEPDNPNWGKYISRKFPISKRDHEIRSDFWRDYNRLLHSKAYRRLKHKTQVFFAVNNDHVCTRIEHVNHVSAVSYSIAKNLGLNTELVLAIATGHDIGHPPFGHDGEVLLRKIAKEHYNGTFWHEQNGLFFADNIEYLQNEKGENETLNLTYAVRDGIISHCGEVDEQAIFPRKEYVDLELITIPNQYNPYTWEACIVKAADKISYIGRDLEDAIRLKIIQKEEQAELQDILDSYSENVITNFSNTTLIHSFATDLCSNSSPKTGILFSEKCFETITRIKQFNYKYIYKHPRLNTFKKYASLVINSIFEILDGLYGENMMNIIPKKKQTYPKLISSFEKWLVNYSDYPSGKSLKVVYNITSKASYQQCIVGFIASMSDFFALELFEELIRFE